MIGEDIAGEHAYQWILSNEERAKNNEEKQGEMAAEILNRIYQIFVARSSALFNPEYILM